METPLSAAPEPKSRFIPSKWEGKRVNIYFKILYKYIIIIIIIY